MEIGEVDVGVPVEIATAPGVRDGLRSQRIKMGSQAFEVSDVHVAVRAGTHVIGVTLEERRQVQIHCCRIGQPPFQVALIDVLVEIQIKDV